MSTLLVTHPTGRYPIHIWRGALTQVSDLLAQAGISGKVAIITNPTVAALYADAVISSLASAGFETVLCTMPDGEQYKTLDTVCALYDQLIDHQLDRNSAVLTLGGGVVGDLGGFVAATYLRGIPLIQSPTTLLAMIDSSMGGKVAVDHPRGKNLIGAFYQPCMVITDPDVLGTLPPAEWRAGLAEVIKHGLISAPELFARLEQQGPAPLDVVVEQAVAVKVEVVQEDPYEKGRRAVLNLGHTFAHAFETVSDYQLRHGEAVGIGLVAATRTAIAMGLCRPEVEYRVTSLLARFDIPTRFAGYDPAAIRAAMSTDKKRHGSRLRFVLPEDIGRVTIRDDVPEEVIHEVLVSLAK